MAGEAAHTHTHTHTCVPVCILLLLRCQEGIRAYDHATAKAVLHQPLKYEGVFHTLKCTHKAKVCGCLSPEKCWKAVRDRTELSAWPNSWNRVTTCTPSHAQTQVCFHLMFNSGGHLQRNAVATSLAALQHAHISAPERSCHSSTV